MRIKNMITRGEGPDIIINSPQYFYKKSKGTRQENLFFDIRGWFLPCLLVGTSLVGVPALRHVVKEFKRERLCVDKKCPEAITTPLLTHNALTQNQQALWHTIATRLTVQRKKFQEGGQR